MMPARGCNVALPPQRHPYSVLTTFDNLEQPQPHRPSPHLIVKMANRGYDVVVDVDQEVGQLLLSSRFLTNPSPRAT